MPKDFSVILDVLIKKTLTHLCPIQFEQTQ